MEALAALGVAAAVIQFVDFAHQTCSGVKHILDDGSDGRLQQISFASTLDDFRGFLESLQGQKKFANGVDRHLSENDQGMDLIVEACTPIVRRLVAIFEELNRIYFEKSEHKKGLSKIRDVTVLTLGKLRAAWRKSEVDSLLDRLGRLQNLLILRMLHHLNVNANESNYQQKNGFDVLSSNYSDIVEVLTVSEQKLNLVQKQAESLQLALDRNEIRAMSRDEKVIAAILTLRNGETKCVKSDDAFEDLGDKTGRKSIMTLKATSPTTTKAHISDFTDVYDRVLSSILFRQILDRVDTVSEAHSKTYDWVFRERVDAEQTRLPLVKWLRRGSGCFMISGKAGSGKSTLMKYIFEDPRTRSALRKWGGGSQLVSASFFFWNLGTDLQKSQSGLLRSLLYSILSNRPYLMTVVMPELLRSAVNMPGSGRLDEPSHAELLRWFRRLLAQATPTFRFFFSIDGLDEYDGDHQDLVDLIRASTRNPNIKFLVSSRPTPISIDAFSRAPTIHLHELTRNDMVKYVNAYLRDHFIKKHGDEWESLVQEIVEKSCGVFLWVVLVCRSLLTGLRNYDNIKELRARIEELPSDLKDLYTHMLHKIPLQYRRQASELFQAVLLATDVQIADVQLSPLQLYFAVQQRDYVLSIPSKPMTQNEIEQKVEEVEGRIRSRSMGLLETRTITREKQRFAPGPRKVQSVEFIHKTAVEFLRAKGVWDEMTQLISNSDFCAAANLFRSCVSMCKTQRIEDVLFFDDSMLWRLMDMALEYASLAETTAHPASVVELEGLNQVVQSHWDSAHKCLYDDDKRLYPEGHWANGYTLHRLSAMNRKLVDATRPVSLDSLMVYHGLASALSSRLKSGSRERTTLLLYDAVKYFISANCRTAEAAGMQKRRAKICIDLLRYGANPNARLGSQNGTSWQLILETARCYLEKRAKFQAAFLQKRFEFLFSQVLVEFISYGAEDHTTTDLLSIIDNLYSTALPQSHLDNGLVNGQERGPGELSAFYRMATELLKQAYVATPSPVNSELSGQNSANDNRPEDYDGPSGISSSRASEMTRNHPEKRKWVSRLHRSASTLWLRRKVF